MKHHTLVALIGSLIALLALQACDDHRVAPQPNRFRLKRTVYSSAFRPNSKDTTTIVYNYDARGNLETEVSVRTNTHDQSRFGTQSFFTYNTRNKLVRIDTRPTIGLLDAPYGYPTRIDYVYDNEERIKTETFSESTTLASQPFESYQVSRVKTFTYDGHWFPATLTDATGTTVYRIKDGNIISSDPNNPNRYDDKPNPYYGVIRSEGIITRIANVNNRYDNFAADSKVTQVMTYNSVGLLTQFNVIQPVVTPPYDYSYQYTYDYEAY